MTSPTPDPFEFFYEYECTDDEQWPSEARIVGQARPGFAVNVHSRGNLPYYSHFPEQRARQIHLLATEQTRSITRLYGTVLYGSQRAKMRKPSRILSHGRHPIAVGLEANMYILRNSQEFLPMRCLPTNPCSRSACWNLGFIVELGIAGQRTCC